jgi:2-deoxy-D-gluconate 3-dehydrogenase
MNPFDLSGRVAIVTGGNGGIGLGIAQGLARAGAAIVVAGRNAAKNEAAVAELGAEAIAIAGDLGRPEDVRALVDGTLARFGRVDVLVNNAGIAIRRHPQEFTLAEWREVIATNLDAAFLCAQAVHGSMAAQGGGKIVNIGSMLSRFGMATAAAYGASKGAIVQMTKALAVAWAGDNIQVNAILPGWIDTELTRTSRQVAPALHDRVVARTPAGRWGTPDDLAGAAVFLASAASDFVTGTEIAVDGGFSAQG